MKHNALLTINVYAQLQFCKAHVCNESYRIVIQKSFRLLAIVNRSVSPTCIQIIFIL